MRPRIAPATLLALAVTLTFTACSSSLDSSSSSDARPSPDGSSSPAASTVVPPTASVTPSPTSTAVSSAQDTYHAAAAELSLPDGYEWPENAPDSSQFSTGEASYVELFWACIRLDAAWAAIDAGDPDEADRLVAPVYEQSTIWASDPPTFGTGPYARDWGWHGICTQQLGLNEYPVEGLAEWTSNS